MKPTPRFSLPLAALALAAALAWPLDARAVTTTGRITGVVMDPTGLPVEAADVEVRGKGIMGKGRQTRTDVDGAYTFADLPPGTCAVTVRSEGFREARVEGLRVEVGRTAQVDVVLEPPLAETAEAVVVTAEAPTVDTERTQTGATINQAFTSRVPTSRDYQGIALMVPGTQNLGNTTSGDNQASGNPIIHGANPYSNAYLLDGINITDPVTNTFSNNFNFDAIEDVEVLTGGRDAEYGSATGGVINVVTKSGGNEFTADGSIYYTPDLSEPYRRGLISPDSRLVPEGLGLYRRNEKPRRQQDLQLNLNLGGPIVQDTLWFFVSSELDFTQGTLPGSAFPDVKNPPARTYKGFMGLGKLTYQAKPWQRFQLLVQGDPATIDNMGQETTRHPDAEIHRAQGGALVALSSDTNLGSHFLLKNKWAFNSSYVQNAPQGGDFDTPARDNATTGTSIGNYHDLYNDRRNRLQYSPQLVASWDWYGGSHETKVGADVMVSWNRTYETYTGGRYFVDSGIPANPSLPGSPYEEVRVVGKQNTAINGDTFGIYVQDVWKPFRSLTIRPGLRFDSTRMRNDRAGDVRDFVRDPRQADGLAGWVQDQAAALGNIFDATVIHLNALSPRLGVAWDPFNDGKTNIHGGYYRYTDTSYLMFAQSVGRSLHTRRYAHNPATGKYDIPGQEEGGESGYLVKSHLSGFNPKDPPRYEDVDLSKPWAPTIQGWDPLQVITGHHVPKTDEFVLGVTREIADSVSVNVDLIGRYISNLYEDDEQNLIWNQDGTRVVDYRNGKQQVVYSLGTPDEAYQVYYGLDFSLRKRLTDRFEGMLSYAFSVNRGTVNTPFSVALDREKQNKYLFGFVEFDRRHILRLMGYYHFPLGFVVGGTFSYLSGNPYNKFRYNEFFGDYRDLSTSRGYDPDNPGRELRMPDLVDTNLRVMWDAEDLTGLKLWLVTDISNVLNLRTPTDIEQRDLPEGSPTRFGDTLDTQSPTRFTFGLRFQY